MSDSHDLLFQHRESTRECIEKLQPSMNALCARFYTHLFTIDPDQASIFDGSAVTLNRKFVNMMATFKSLRRIENMESAIEKLAQRHVNYGMRPQHLIPFGQALIDALAEHMGEKFTDELREAWTSSFVQVSSRMRHAIEQHPEWLEEQSSKQDNHHGLDLLDQIGGIDVVKNVHARFYTDIFEDEWLGQFFGGKNKEALIHKQTNFMVACFGGPSLYVGEPPALAHMHMLITEEMALEREKILHKAIIDEGLSEDIATRWLKIDRSFWPAINKTSVDECVTKCFGQAPATAKKPLNYKPR